MQTLSYLSKIPGIGGTIKNSPEDFIVEEITQDGTVLERDKKLEVISKKSGVGSKFVHFILQKRDWSTNSAIKEIAKRLRINERRFNFAGNKDKIAITTQLVSCFGVRKEDIEKLNIKDIKILGSWYADEKIDLGDLLENRFTIKVQDCDEGAEEKVKKIYDELDGKIPNYFGEQRFGTTRQNTHIIGEKILRNDFEGAAISYLCDSDGEEHADARAAREELRNTRDYKNALKFFPKHLRLERSMLACLEKNSNDYIGAFRKLPRNILLLFVHAFQSQLFNEMLSQRIGEREIKLEEGEKVEGGAIYGKLIGYETEINEREKKLLKKFNITKQHFNIRSIPEISSKGTYRTLFALLKDFSFSEATNTFKFSLPSGSYATVAMREFLDQKIPEFPKN